MLTATETRTAGVIAALRTGLDLPAGFMPGLQALEAADFGVERYRASRDAERTGLVPTEDYLDRGLLANKMFITAMLYRHLQGGGVPGAVQMTPCTELDLFFEACVVLNGRWEVLCKQVFGLPVYHVMGTGDPESLMNATLSAISELFDPAMVPWEFFTLHRCSGNMVCWGTVGSSVN